MAMAERMPLLGKNKQGVPYSTWSQWNQSFIGTEKRGANESSDEWRLLDREAAFRQSLGRWKVVRLNRSKRLYMADLFHTITAMSLSKVTVIFFSLYILVIVAFSPLYWLVSEQCGLGITNFRSAYYFSLQTIMTIGFGLPAEMKNPPYFQQCDAALFIITLESLMGVMADALCVGLMYERLARAQTRATTIVFSDRACISVEHPGEISGAVVDRHEDSIGGGGESMSTQSTFPVSEEGKDTQTTSQSVSNLAQTEHRQAITAQRMGNNMFLHGGKTTMTLRVCEMRKHQLVEAHVRCYAIVRGPLKPESLLLRRRSSNMTAKSTGTHRTSVDRQKTTHPIKVEALRLSMPDDELGAMLILNLPATITHEITSDSPLYPVTQTSTSTDNSNNNSGNTLISIRDHMNQNRIEVVVLVEGIDPVSGSTVQARHSYTADDIAWQAELAECVEESLHGGLVVDFAKFHQVYIDGEITDTES